MDYVKSQAWTAKAKDDRHAWAEPGVEDLGDGLYRIPLPLPGDALTAVNVYAIVSDNGVDLVDAGMAIAQARERLTEALEQLGLGLPDIRNFLITHIHQDHYTLAVELRTTLRGQIVLGDQERGNMAAIRDVSAGRAEVGFIEMLGRMGADSLAEQVRARMEPRLANPQPKLEWSDPDRWLPDGAVIDLPGRALRAIHTPGHTTGHVVFHDEAAALLPVMVPPIPILSVLASVPAKVRVLLPVSVLPAASVRVPVPVVIVLPLIDVAVRAPNACVPVNVCPASVRATLALVPGNVIVVPSVPASVSELLSVSTFPETTISAK